MRLRTGWFRRDQAIAFVRRCALTLLATAVPTAPGLGDSQKPDKVVAPGEVMCAWSIYLSIQMMTAHCGFARVPMDDAIDDAIADIEELVLAHVPDVARPTLEDAKRIMKESPLFNPARKKNYCEEGGFVFFNIRDRDPDQFRKGVKELLSRPLGPARPVGCFL